MSDHDHIMALLLPAIARRLPSEAPNVSIQAGGLAAFGDDPVAAALAGHIDQAVGSFAVTGDALPEGLYTEHWVCAVSADNPK